MSWYRTGTISITSGQTLVAGSGTFFLSVGKLKSGDLFSVSRDKFYEIERVDSDTQLTLKDAYNEATATISAYVVIPNFTSTLTAQLAAQLQSLLTKWHGRENEMLNWLSGEGQQPLTDVLGVSHLIDTPAEMLAKVNARIAELDTAWSGAVDATRTDVAEYFGMGYRPACQPSLVADFANNKYQLLGDNGLEDKAFSDLFTLTRASTATRINHKGLIESSLVDAPRFNYDPETGENLGILIEDGSTNLVLNSEDFQNASWSKSGTTLLSTDTVTGIDGTGLATKIVKDSGQTSAAYVLEDVGMQSDNKTFVASIYMKPAELASVAIAIRGKEGSYHQVVFNSETKFFTVTDGSPDDYDFEKCSDGYYRVWVNKNIGSDAAQATTRAVYYVVNQSNVSFTGDGTSGIYIWGAQFEEGIKPTSYTKTTTSQVTRSLDVLSRSIGSEFNAREGTFYVSHKGVIQDGAAMFFSVGEDNTNYLGLGYSSSTLGYMLPFAGVIAGSNNQSIPNKWCFSYKVIDESSVAIKIIINGEVKYTATKTGDTSLIANWHTLRIGSRSDGFFRVDQIVCPEFKYYPHELEIDEMRRLTA